MDLNFIKMNGLGNDFIVIDARCCTEEHIDVVQLCDRRRGIGCDQLIILKSSDIADIRMIIYNSDGSISAMCGNAARCVARLIASELGCFEVKVMSGDRILDCNILDTDRVIVNMGEPVFDWKDIPLAHECDAGEIYIRDFGNIFAVGMGNPHAVSFVEDVTGIDIESLGKKISNDKIFPEGANVEFVAFEKNSLIVRVWERGVGETLACGSGACAVFAAACKLGLIDFFKPCDVIFPGGKLVLIGRDSKIMMEGEALINFYGSIKL